MGVKKYLEAGKIVSVFGIKGEIKVQPWCDGPEFLCGFDTLYYKSGTPVEIERSRVAKNIVVMKVKGVDTVEEAQKLRNRVLYIDRDDVELDEDCYFVQDLIGLEVVDADSGESYGKITDVSQTGANDVYHITDEKGNVKLIPAIPEVVAETDIEGGVMKITPLRSPRAEEKWLIKRLRKESGFNRLANTYEGEGLSFMELDNMLTSLRVYYNNEGNKPKKRRSALWSLFVVIIIAIVVTIGVVQGIGYYEKSGGSVQEHLNSAEENWAYQPFDMIWRN